MCAVCPHLLIAEAHLPARIPAHVHPAQEHPALALQRRRRRAVMGGRMDAGARRRRHTAAELRLDGAVVLLVDDVVDAVAVDEQVLHGVAEVLGGVVADVQQLAVLREHHQEAREGLF